MERRLLAKKSSDLSIDYFRRGEGSYPARTMKNIEESDGTVIFSLERVLVARTKLTWVHANKVGKPGAGTSMMPERTSFELRFGSLKDARADSFPALKVRSKS